MRIILLLTILSCAVIMTNQINASTSLMVKAPVSTSARRLYLDSRSLRDRRLKITMPKQMCAPAASAGAFLIEQLMDCAIKILTAGAGEVAQKAGKAVSIGAKTVQRGIAAGKTAGKKLGLFGIIEKKKHELTVFIMRKLLGSLGCPKKRRLNFFKKVGKSFKKAAKVVKKVATKTVNHVATQAKKAADNAAKQAKKTADNAAKQAKKTATGAAKQAKKGVDHAAKQVKKTADKAAKQAAKEVKKHAKEIKKVVKKQAKIIKKAGKTCLKKAKHLVKDLKKVAVVAAKFAKKYGAVILAVACPVIQKTCQPACAAAVAGISAGAAYFGVPVMCVSGALEAGCNKLCKAICGKRRLMIRRTATY